MRIDPKQLLFGQPILKIRQVIRQAMTGRLNAQNKQAIVERISVILDKPVRIAKNVFEPLVKEEYLEIKEEKFNDGFLWLVSETEKGRRLGVTRANPPISRAKADRLLKELLERVRQVNSNDAYAYKVACVKIFGSYLSEQEVLGDLDVAVKLTQRDHEEIFDIKSEKRIDIALKNGRTFRRAIDEFYWPHQEIMMFLKTRKKGLSLHDEKEDRVVGMTECKVVFED